ncbi:MAG: hypothetical protein ABJB74_12930 [Gemmatimonas sp.]
MLRTFGDRRQSRSIHVDVAALRLPDLPAIRDAMFAIAPWLLAQVVMMTMMSMAFFS